MGDFYFSALLKWQTRVIPNSETVLSMHAVFGRHRRCRQHVHNRSTCVDTQFRRAASACGIMRTMSDIKTPPQNTEAERAVLGSILLDTTGRSDGRVMDECRSRGVTPETFFDPSNRAIFATMLEMGTASKPLDALALIEELRRTNKLDAVGGVGYIQSLIDQVPTTAHAEHYIGILRAKHLRRLLIERATDVVARC